MSMYPIAACIVGDIIGAVVGGNAFDSHFVIDTLIRDHSDAYLTFVAGHLASSNVTPYAHSEIAKVFASFEGTLVERLPFKSFSYNIRGKASPCTLWRKI